MSETPWFALRVKSRHEKAVAYSLRQKKFEVFLPLYQARHRWKDRVTTVDLPLFSNYVFCQFEPVRKVDLLRTPGLWEIVSCGHQPVELLRSEIEAIQRILTCGMNVEPCHYLLVGDSVRIVAGPLRGVEGLVTDMSNRPTLVVSVSLLQRSVGVEVDLDWLEHTDPASPKARYLRAAQASCVW
jgi:transcriptional antiterminator NusG